MLRQLARQALSRRSRGPAAALTALAGCTTIQSCGFAAGAKGFRRPPKRPLASDKAASEAVLRPTSGDGLANPSGEQAEPTWVPVRHKSGRIYYWNKRTGASRAAEPACLCFTGGSISGPMATCAALRSGSLQE